MWFLLRTHNSENHIYPHLDSYRKRMVKVIIYTQTIPWWKMLRNKVLFLLILTNLPSSHSILCQDLHFPFLFFRHRTPLLSYYELFLKWPLTFFIDLLRFEIECQRRKKVGRNDLKLCCCQKQIFSLFRFFWWEVS